MRTRGFAAVFLASVLILGTLASLLSSAAAPIYKWMNTIEVMVPGVVATPHGYRGTLSKLVVTVAWPGKGIVYFSADPLTELDTQAAARMAALVASILAGVNYYSYDYFIRLESNTTLIGGPSASGAMTIAILAALRGTSISTDFSMTGMVDPDTTLGPVGGIPQKLEAAARAGAKIFVIPIGERYSVDLNTGEKVDVLALGKELGVKVVEAGTIAEAYEIATGDKLFAESSLPSVSYPSWLLSALNESMNVYREAAYSNMTCAEKALAKLPSPLSSQLSSILEDAKHNIEVAENLRAAGKLYAAASRYFAAAIEATYVCSAANAYTKDNPLTALADATKNYADKATTLLEHVNRTLSKVLASKTNITDIGLQLYIASMTRLVDASSNLDTVSTMLEIAKKSTSHQALQALDKALQAAVYAYYRALTADQWLGLALEANGGTPIDFDLLFRGVEIYVYFAESAMSYLQTLGVDVTDVGGEIAAAKAMIQQSTSSADRIALLRALAYTVEGLAEINSKLHVAFNTGITVLDASQKSLRVLLQRLAGLNITPVLPILYSEYADTQVDINAKLSLYVQASSYALLLALIGNRQPNTLFTTTENTGTSVANETITPTAATTQAAETVTVTSTVTKTHTLTTTISKEVGETATRASEKNTTPLIGYLVVASTALAAGIILERLRRSREELY